jgi:hypothetical protein
MRSKNPSVDVSNTATPSLKLRGNDLTVAGRPVILFANESNTLVVRSRVTDLTERGSAGLLTKVVENALRGPVPTALLLTPTWNPTQVRKMNVVESM